MGFLISDGDWSNTGQLLIDIDGFTEGTQNEGVFAGAKDTPGPDLVGIEEYGGNSYLYILPLCSNSEPLLY